MLSTPDSFSVLDPVPGEAKATCNCVANAMAENHSGPSEPLETAAGALSIDESVSARNRCSTTELSMRVAI